jgi:hypothetical protein
MLSRSTNSPEVEEGPGLEMSSVEFDDSESLTSDCSIAHSEVHCRIETETLMS